MTDQSHLQSETIQTNSKKQVSVSSIWNELNTIKEKNEAINKLKPKKQYTVFNMLIPNPESIDADEQDDLEKWKESFEDDIMLNEALNILSIINHDEYKESINHKKKTL